MKDRVPLYPGRVKLTPVSGQENTYDMIRADEPTQEGTPLNKASLLTDATAALLGLGADAVPDEAFSAIASYSLPSNGDGALFVVCKTIDGNPVSGCVVTVGDLVTMSDRTGVAAFIVSGGATYSGSVTGPIDYGAKTYSFSGAKVYSGRRTSVAVTIQDESGGAFEIDFESSVIAAFSDRVTKADVFGVGGGGGGGAGHITGGQKAYGAGGAGGYTGTVLNLDLSELFVISVGAGGNKVSIASGSANYKKGGAGGATTVATKSGEAILTVAGGSGGAGGYNDGSRLIGAGANGGTGSGAAIADPYNNGFAGVGDSGVDGASGGNVTESGYTAKGGTGQGNTTRAFGESGGELFSSAGGTALSYNGETLTGTTGAGGGAGAASMGANNATAGYGTTPGSGGGGASNYGTSQTGYTFTSGAGHAGLVRFRWEVS